MKLFQHIERLFLQMVLLYWIHRVTARADKEKEVLCGRDKKIADDTDPGKNGKRSEIQ